ncbi:MAG: 50S ribosomal protein L10 [Phycisphaerae bacterium]|nr:50S ribosomal protein L10 [Phycisphaerae bacterium]
MSKPVKELLRKDLAKRLEGVTSLAVVSLTGIDAVATNRIRAQLKQKDVKLSVVKNAVAKSAFDTVGIPDAKQMLDGPCALAWGGDSVVTIVRELLELAKEAENLKVKAALLDGEVFGPDRVEQLSKFPTRDEAIATVATTALSPAAKLAGCLAGPVARLAGAIKGVSDKQDDGGESAEAA